MVVLSMSLLVTGVFSSARMPETTIDSLRTGFCWSSIEERRKRRRNALMSPLAFPYAGLNRIRFQGVISGRHRPPLGLERGEESSTRVAPRSFANGDEVGSVEVPDQPAVAVALKDEGATARGVRRRLANVERDHAQIAGGEDLEVFR